MSIVIDLPPPVQKDAEALARARGESLAELAGRLVSAYVDEMREQADDARAVDAALAKIRSGEESWLGWDDVKAANGRVRDK